ncbi:unnamed protein product [marine sediment metagenome]|uniref:Uncharacterized protein n=1 Tax=marine sediment metagenome TaxID=412755 RepID=X1APL8_9ZZZZ
MKKESTIGSLKSILDAHPGLIYPYFIAAETLDTKIREVYKKMQPGEEMSSDWLLLFPRNYGSVAKNVGWHEVL